MNILTEIPNGSTTWREGINANLQTIDQAIIASGTSLPTVGTSSKYFYRTDTGQLFYDTGSAWRWISGNRSINTYTTSITLALSDSNARVRVNSSSDLTVTVPPNSSVTFPIGTEIFLARMGTGLVTVVAGSGVTLNAASLSIASQYSTVRLVKIASNEWDIC
ncbi:TPA: hypothetical protein DDW35_08175 [Candidatus Sumerlaeota bacterium]|jgi:hypothetical protein|nr:hypothetical protein [Candidatus Sumerlaeota bacterium]